MSKLITMSADYHDITRLLPLMIIVIDKQNITVNRHNRLIAHPYFPCGDSLKDVVEGFKEHWGIPQCGGSTHQGRSQHC